MSEEISWPYEDEMMQDIFDRLKIKGVSWRTVKEYADDYQNKFKDDVLQESIDLDAIQAFDEIFDWGDHNITLDRAKAKLVDWIRKHKEFYNDDLRITYNRMKETLAEKNAEMHSKIRRNAKWTDYPYINWLPEYGGRLRRDRWNGENRFHKKHLANKFFLAPAKKIGGYSANPSENEDNEQYEEEYDDNNESNE